MANHHSKFSFDIRNLSVRWYIAAFILFTLWCISDPAKADLYATGSVSKITWQDTGDGYWQQPNRPNATTKDLTSTGYALGLGYAFRYLAVEVLYHKLDGGSMDTFAERDEDYLTGSHGHEIMSHCFSEWSVKGWEAALLPKYTIGPVTLNARIGIFKGTETWHVTGHYFNTPWTWDFRENVTTRTLGAGVGYAISPRSTLTVSYTTFEDLQITEGGVKSARLLSIGYQVYL